MRQRAYYPLANAASEGHAGGHRGAASQVHPSSATDKHTTAHHFPRQKAGYDNSLTSKSCYEDSVSFNICKALRTGHCIYFYSASLFN